jgi:hypothetical protein
VRRLVWFSCGAASAVAAKLAVEKYAEKVQVVYCDTSATEHPDNLRFLQDVEKWLGRNIIRIRSADFKDIDDVFEKRRYMVGPKGAPCTTLLKKVPREVFQFPDDVHIFGYTAEEQRRAEKFENENKSLMVEWILIDEQISKSDCILDVELAGIRLPEMYRLDFDHNNCLGCVKSQSPGYWNKTRRHFPETFARRCRQSRILGVRLVRVGAELGAQIPEALPKYEKGKLTGYRIFLDTLPLEADAPDDDIDCGPVCQVPMDDLSDILGLK